MSKLADLKIPLQRDHHGQRYWDPVIARPTDVTSSLPIYVSRFGRYAHRVRSGHYYMDLDKPAERGHVAFSLWCGQTGTLGRKGSLHAVPPRGYPLCGTCEGRAVGAGYPGIAILRTRYDLIYSPREGRAPMPATTETAG